MAELEKTSFVQNITAAEAVSDIFKYVSCPLHDKQEVLLTIIEHTKDEKIRVNGFATTPPEEISLHKLVRDYVSEERTLEQAFFSDEPETVYLAEFRQLDTGETASVREPALTWNACAENLVSCRDWEIVSGPHRVVVTKFYPTQFVNGFMKELTVELDENGELMEIGSQMMMTVPRYRELYCMMASLTGGKYFCTT